jgi:hypothetical protein
MGIMRVLARASPDAYLSITIMRPAMSCLIGQALAQGASRSFRHGTQACWAGFPGALDGCGMALDFCATLGIHTPSFGEAATWNHDVLVQQKQEGARKCAVLDAYQPP